MGLTSLAYLWKRNQKELLKEMIDSHIHAILIKVATMGLEPKKHLGKTISEMYPYLLKIVSICIWGVCGNRLHILSWDVVQVCTVWVGGERG